MQREKWSFLKILSVSFLLVIVVAAFAGCAQPAPSTPDASDTGTGSESGESTGADAADEEATETEWEGEIPIGVLFSEDGAWGSYGAKSFRAISIAIEDVNAAGGINGYKLVEKRYDNHAQIEQVASIVRKMALEDDVVAMIGPNTSGEGEVAFPVAAQLGLPVLSTSTAKGGIMPTGQAEDGTQWVFRNVMPDNENTAPVIARVIEEEGIETAGIIMDTKDAVSNFMGSMFWPTVFEENGVEVVETVTFNSGDPSVTAQVTSLKAANPDAVALAASPGEAAKIAIEIQQQRMETQLLGAGGLFGDEFLEAGGEAVEGAITAAQFWPDNPDPKAQELLQSLEARTGEKPVLHEAYGYDAVMLLAEIMREAGVTDDASKLEEYRAAIRDGLEGRTWQGMSGEFELLPNGEVVRPFLKATIEGGEWQIETLDVEAQ